MQASQVKNLLKTMKFNNHCKGNEFCFSGEYQGSNVLVEFDEFKHSVIVKHNGMVVIHLTGISKGVYNNLKELAHERSNSLELTSEGKAFLKSLG